MLEGVASFLPTVRLAIDIGGQDAESLKINSSKLIYFVMSDKCCAGTVRFLEVISAVLGLKLEDLGSISLKSTRNILISSTSTVFASRKWYLASLKGYL